MSVIVTCQQGVLFQVQGSCSGFTTPRFNRAAAGSWSGSRQMMFEARAAHLPSSILAATPLTLESPGAGATFSSRAPGRHRALLELVVLLQISGGARGTISYVFLQKFRMVRRFRTRRRIILPKELRSRNENVLFALYRTQSLFCARMHLAAFCARITFPKVDLERLPGRDKNPGQLPVAASVFQNIARQWRRQESRTRPPGREQNSKKKAI